MSLCQTGVATNSRHDERGNGLHLHVQSGSELVLSPFLKRADAKASVRVPDAHGKARVGTPGFGGFFDQLSYRGRAARIHRESFDTVRLGSTSTGKVGVDRVCQRAKRLDGARGDGDVVASLGKVASQGRSQSRTSLVTIRQECKEDSVGSCQSG